MTIIINSISGNVPGIAQPNYGVDGMSFLDLVKRLRQESGTSGAAPATTINQSGDVRNLVDWVSTAWMDIQNERADWSFMRQAVAFNTTANKGSYSAADAGIASFGNFKLDSFRQYRVAAGYASEIGLSYIPWGAFRDAYLFGVARDRRQMPIHFTVDPAKNFVIGPAPDDIFNINGEAFAMPTELRLDADRPTMPAQFHMMIVWRALVYYGYKEAAPEALTFGRGEYERLKSMLMIDQLPNVMLGGALC